MKISKKDIVSELVFKVEEEMKIIKDALKSTTSHIKDADLKQEGKYDTRAIEAGYLADGQRKRLAELEQELKLLEEITVRDFTFHDEVKIGALVVIELNKMKKHYFISPTAGGTLLNLNNTPILVISVFSPIGAAVLGLSIGDSFEIETPKDTRVYQVQEIF